MNAMGARVKGAGSMVITIEGVKAMHGTEFTCMPDRIEAGTLLAAVMAAKGNVVLKNTNPQSYASVLETMEAANAKIKRYKSEVELTMHTRPKAFDIETAPYPGFPTDMQAQMCVLACLAEGTSKIKETVFENRLKHLEGLKNAGAQIYTDGRTAFITGKEALLPAEYTARDLRGGAAYVIAALASEGRSSVSCVHFIDRGYEHLENKLKLLGADITRV